MLKSKSVKPNDERVAQFCGVTGATVKDAIKFIQKFKRVDVAIDAFYSDPNAIASASQSKGKNNQAAQQATSRLTELFDTYKEKDSDIIGVDGTMKLCEELNISLEDVVLLAVAYELKLPSVGVWERKGWMEGWKALNCDSITAMRGVLPRLRDQLGSQATYFNKVYSHTFNFAKSEGQRSLGTETAIAFWQLLLPHAIKGGALAHTQPENEDEDEDEDDTMQDVTDDGWRPEYVDLWFAFLNEKGGKGVSKDSWMMLPEFIRTIDSKFERHDEEGAWPSTIDDFVHWAREKLKQ